VPAGPFYGTVEFEALSGTVGFEAFGTSRKEQYQERSRNNSRRHCCCWSQPVFCDNIL